MTIRKISGLLIAGAGVSILALHAAPSGAQPAKPAAKLDVESVTLGQDNALRVKGEKTFFFRGEFMIDADGSPRAYHPGYTCGGTTSKGWKRATKIKCAALATNDCRKLGRGFRDEPAAGTMGDYVTCATKKVGKTWVCAEKSVTRRTQGDCTQDATANDGQDYLANAGEPGNFYGLAKDKTGNPFIQGPKDPAPGYYVSQTALGNPAISDPANPKRYVDASTVNYIALPKNASLLGAKVGDCAFVINWNTGAAAGAVFADVGSDSDKDVGEGSIALAKELGIKGTPKGGGQREDVVYIVFAGSACGFPKDAERLETHAQFKFSEWGGNTKLMRAIPKDWADDFMKP
jgi:hypothetical protein